MIKDIKELYDQGVEFYEQGNYLEAEGLLREVLKFNPRFADVHNKLGIMASLNGELKEAAEHFENALNINPSYTEAALNLSITYNELQETDKAQDVFERASRAMVESPGSIDRFVAGKLANEHFKLGNLYLEFNRYDEAIEEYGKATRLRPDLADVQTKLGVALRDSGRIEASIEHFKKAKETNPSYWPAWVQLGLAYFKTDKKELAFQEWEDALQKNPELKEARSFLNFLKDRK